MAFIMFACTVGSGKVVFLKMSSIDCLVSVSRPRIAYLPEPPVAPAPYSAA
jgi:hypothetical protein